MLNKKSAMSLSFQREMRGAVLGLGAHAILLVLLGVQDALEVIQRHVTGRLRRVQARLFRAVFCPTPGAHRAPDPAGGGGARLGLPACFSATCRRASAPVLSSPSFSPQCRQ